MKITEVRLGRISVPLRTPFKTALRTVNSVEDVIVEIHTDTGAVGYGEAPPTGVITGDTTGAIIGAIQGYYGGWVDMIIDRTTDILSGLPFMVCVTLFQLHFAKSVGVVPAFLFSYVLTGWIGMSALTRKQFYRFKGQEYVMAARTLGASDKRLMFKHIFPNAIGTIITSCVLTIPGVISTETSFAYLGIIDLSDFAGTSIGKLMSMGQGTAANYPHTLLFPALFVALLLICFNLFGNGLRDAFNPSNRGVED